MTPEALARAMAEKLTAWDLRFQPATTASNVLLPYGAALVQAREKLSKVVAWQERLADRADEQAKDTRFPSLAEANRLDAKNYRATAADLRPTIDAIDALLPAQGEGER